MKAKEAMQIALSDEVIEQFAHQAGILSEDQQLTDAVKTFTLLIAEQCAQLVEDYHDKHEGNAGDAIRAAWGIS